MCLQEMYLKRPSLCAWWRMGGLGFLLSCELIPGNAQGKGERFQGELFWCRWSSTTEPWVLCEPCVPLGCSTFIADNSAWMPWLERQRCSLLICFPHGRKFTNRAAAIGWKISSRWSWSSAHQVHHCKWCGNCVVVVKLGLFVNLFRCLDGWLETDFIGHY